MDTAAKMFYEITESIISITVSYHSIYRKYSLKLANICLCLNEQTNKKIRVDLE